MAAPYARPPSAFHPLADPADQRLASAPPASCLWQSAVLRHSGDWGEKRGRSRKWQRLSFYPHAVVCCWCGVFSAYKFLKMKSQEGSSSKKEKNTEDKAKETEHQLLELEQHLAQTEKNLNSLLTQLDPLSNCVNALACEQKEEIMTQLQSIRQLMKESGLDKSEMKLKNVNHTCNEKLEDLIQSFGFPHNRSPAPVSLQQYYHLLRYLTPPRTECLKTALDEGNLS
uniref:Resistance to inhibitors of cholinesterase protein 3 N-terminal domain-containing protein n=1 Tax=Chelydra serpentina TaxID=8475 RepID=A0A8C3SVK6_CHESE